MPFSSMSSISWRRIGGVPPLVAGILEAGVLVVRERAHVGLDVLRPRNDVDHVACSLSSSSSPSDIGAGPSLTRRAPRLSTAEHST